MACLGGDNVNTHIRRLNRDLDRQWIGEYRYADYRQEEVAADSLFDPETDYRIFRKPYAEYKRHPLQTYFNKQRHFDLTDQLYNLMYTHGSSVFYQYVCTQPPAEKATPADLTSIQSLNTISTAAEYLYSEIKNLKGEQSASVAKISYMRGFSRPVQADSREDWEKLRNQLRSNDPSATIVGEDGNLRFQDATILPIAISYKGSNVKISRRMVILDDDGNAKKDEGLLALGQGIENNQGPTGFTAQETISMSEDFVHDFRWDQVRRSCAQISKHVGKQHVSVWIDRLVMWQLEDKEKRDRYNLVDWEDFGLMPYAVCPVVRVYEINETEYGTDFWRKLETAMGVAGCGLFLDDYMVRHYDDSMYFRPEMYREIPSGDGICIIGGNGRFLRSVSLALATAILTDAISVHQRNEDIRTVRAIRRWKSWALRTIGEGAYKKEQPMMMTGQEAYSVGMQEFKTIAFWESYVSHSTYLQGNGYLDMSIPQSFQYHSCRTWDGVREWLGMVAGSFNVTEEQKIKGFLNMNVYVEAWTSTTRHVAVLLQLTHPDYVGYKRTLTVGLTRFSNTTHGQVISLAESTGLWDFENRILPKRFVFIVSPETDQEVQVENGKMTIIYHPLKKGYRPNIWWRRTGLIIGMVIFFICIISFAAGGSGYIAVIFAFFLLVMLFTSFVFPGHWWRKEVHIIGGSEEVAAKVTSSISTACCLKPRRIWDSSVGEAIFDNLRMHGLFNSQIKEKEYRKMRSVPYAELDWN